MKLIGELLGSIVALIPYEKWHVPLYHKWMQDPYLRETTKSEHVHSLEHQYQIQAKWVSDPLRGAFMIVDMTNTTTSTSSISRPDPATATVTPDPTTTATTAKAAPKTYDTSTTATTAETAPSIRDYTGLRANTNGDNSGRDIDGWDTNTESHFGGAEGTVTVIGTCAPTTSRSPGNWKAQSGSSSRSRNRNRCNLVHSQVERAKLSVSKPASLATSKGANSSSSTLHAAAQSKSKSLRESVDVKSHQRECLDEEVVNTDSAKRQHLAGDVNFFLSPHFAETREVELLIMIAEKSSRGKGIATEALQLLIHYCRTQFGAWRFVAKVAAENTASLSLFKAKLGFKPESFDQSFQHYVLAYEDPWAEKCREELREYEQCRSAFFHHLGDEQKDLLRFQAYPLPMHPRLKLTPEQCSMLKQVCERRLDEKHSTAKANLESAIKKWKNRVCGPSSVETDHRPDQKRVLSMLKRLEVRRTRQSEKFDGERETTLRMLEKFLKRYNKVEGKENATHKQDT